LNARSLLTLAAAGTILVGMAANSQPAHAGNNAFIGGLVGGVVAGAVIGGAVAAASAPRPAYYYGGPAYVAPPPVYPAYPVYPRPYYRPCPPGYLCR
jgi:hypothetical protein